MLKKLLAIAWVVLVGFTLSCKGPQGEVGPKGDTGATGAAGPTGATGAAGKDGEGGGGAIILSYGEVQTTDGQYVMGVEDLTAEEEAAFDASVVQVFVKSDGLWWPMPGRAPFGDELSSFSYAHGIEDGTFLTILYTTGWTEDTDVAPERTFEDLRLILIPGEIQNLRTSAEVDWKNYDQVVAALGLKETDVKKVNYSHKQLYKGLILDKIKKGLISK